MDKGTAQFEQQVTELAEWQHLATLCKQRASHTLSQWFDQDPDRAERFAIDAAELHVDFSKQRIDEEILAALVYLAQARDMPAAIAAMFDGKHINTTEDRPALHVALRAPQGSRMVVDGENVVDEVHRTLERMVAFSREVRDGHWKGHSGKPIRNIVNIGIGGSDLGPVMVHEALRDYARRDIRVRFVSNIDASDLVEALQDLEPAETLFIVCSKSFGTRETLTNARSARDWLLAGLGQDTRVERHFVAVSSHRQRVEDFGIARENMFPLWDWVGGRYSVDSAIGLSLMLAIGPDGFREMLAGFHAMDEHFRTTPLASNLPVLHGLIGIWNSNFLGADTQAVLPYDAYLHRFPAYLQQLTMESNGKRTTLAGMQVACNTAPILWGQPGTNGQHSFYQLLHQGTRPVPCDFIGFCQPLHPLGEHHDMLMANLFAQSAALAFGRSEAQLVAEASNDADQALIPYRICPGNRPSTTILARQLAPRSLGSLVALYEHSVYVQSRIWGINAFDQWGVELGKHLARGTLAAIHGDDDATNQLDGASRALIAHYQMNQTPG